MKVKVLEGQNLMDIALQEYGTIDKVLKLAEDNNLSVDAVLTPGTELNIDADNIGCALIQQTYAAVNYHPTSEV